MAKNAQVNLTVWYWMFDLGNTAVVELLIDMGADIYSVNGRGKIPFELSIEHGKLIGFLILKRNYDFFGEFIDFQ